MQPKSPFSGMMHSFVTRRVLGRNQDD